MAALRRATPPIPRASRLARATRLRLWRKGCSPKTARPSSARLSPAHGPAKHGRASWRWRVLSEQRQLSCEQHSSPNPKLQLRRKGTPLRQRSRASLLVDFAADEMALLIEVVVDLGMN